MITSVFIVPYISELFHMRGYIFIPCEVGGDFYFHQLMLFPVHVFVLLLQLVCILYIPTAELGG